MHAPIRPFLLAAIVLIAAPLGACSMTSMGAFFAGDERPRAITPPPAPPSIALAYGDYLSGNLAASEHDLNDASRFYRAALARDPQNADLLSRAFLYTAAIGAIDQAAPLASRVVAINPNERTARLVLTVAAFAHGDYTNARSEIAQSARGPFSSLTLTLLDAWAADGQGHTDQAFNDLAQVTDQGGSEALAHFHRALILDLAGKDVEAEKEYRAALLASGPAPREVEAYGRFLERLGRKADAAAFYAKFKGQPSLEPIIEQAEARMASGSVPERLIQTPSQGAAEALFGIAASLTDPSSVDVAVLYLRLALYLSPDLDLARIVLADRFESLEKWREAIAIYDSVAETSPFKFAASVQAAIDHSRIDENDVAIAALTKLTAAHPDSVTAWTALGDAWRSDNQFSKASAAYSAAIRALGKPTEKDWPLFFARATCEQEIDNWPAAEADLKKALALSPNQAQILNFLGYSWVDRGEHLDKAVVLLEKARALSPTDGYIVDSVGWAYYRLGRYKDAVAALAQAVQLVPSDPTINDHYGDALWRVGRHLEAHYQWDHALTFGATGTEQAELEQKLLYGLPSVAKHRAAEHKR